jgi:glycosyltransferase involved in cell wall biosynthesis
MAGVRSEQPAFFAFTERSSIAVSPETRSMKVLLEGDFVAGGSLGVVNRNLARALLRCRELDVAIRTEPNRRRLCGNDEVLEPLRTKRFDATDVTIRHRWPPALSDVPSGYYVQIQPCEYGALPKAWTHWRDVVDDVWCYSTYVAQQYLDAGFPSGSVHVVPLGIDPEIFHPNEDGTPPIQVDRRCVFLFVGGTVPRKGIDLLVNVYLSTFRPTDDVALIIKDVDPFGTYSNATLRSGILPLAARKDVAKIVYTDRNFTDLEMAALYRSATCLVHPYRGEGFGLPVLEAMACGRPAIVSRGGATDDFVPIEHAYPIQTKRVPANAGDIEMASDPWLIEPDPYELQAAMRAVYDDLEGASEKGKAAASFVHAGWTWDNTARKVVERVNDLVSAESPTHKRIESVPVTAFERKLSSQNGEDGIINELFRRIGVTDSFFVEFGVQDGLECNTRYLAMKYDWSGILMECDPAQFARLQETYRATPRVKTIQAFVTRENACELFSQAGIPQEFDLLSIDIDGNDYWVWEALAAHYRPRVVVIEINPAYPPPRRWVMEYNPAHAWRFDNYFGASLESMNALGKRLGYRLIGMESAGVNAFFVREDQLALTGFPELTPMQAFQTPAFRHPERLGPYLEI